MQKLVSILVGVVLASDAGTAAENPAPQKWRWEQMDNGRFFSSNLQGKQASLKTVTVKLGLPGNPEAAAVNFDTMTLRWNAAWTGGFLHLPKGRDGLEGLPEPWGDVQFSTPVGPGWAKSGEMKDPRPTQYQRLPDDWAKWRGLYLSGDQVLLSYTLGGVGVLELPGLREVGPQPVFTRTIQFERKTGPQSLLVFADPGGVFTNAGAFVAMRNDQTKRWTAAAVIGVKGVTWEVLSGGRVVLHLPRVAANRPFRLAVWKTPGGRDPSAFPEKLEVKLDDLRHLTKGGPARWGAPLSTRGKLAANGGDGPYVVDTITPPDDNPYKSWLRFAGFDFFKDASKAAICSVSGDVWIVSGLDETLGEVKWKRYATGLFQPLGLKIVDDVVYVLGRDQITRLKDLNHDGEADFYECFNNDITITPEYHEFCLGLETDRTGNFYFNKGGNLGWSVLPHHGCTLRVSKDGRKLEIVANGLRAPNGLGMGPHDEITSSDNEGNWVPACRVNLVKPGGFYGHVFTAHTPTPHTNGYDAPLFWLPKGIDNSSGGEGWVTSGKWGPFAGDMLHSSYGMCSLFKVMYEETDGVAQGGVVRFPLKFDSGIMRLRFSPRDGQLYTCGLVVWQSNGARQGAFHRVRYTGKPVVMPRELRVKRDGVEVTFTQPLDRASVVDLQNWSVERWNYRWTEDYGSPEFSVTDPNKKAHDPVAVKSARLSADGRTVFLELAVVAPVMQQKIKFSLQAADGTRVSQEIYHTINKVPSGGSAVAGK
jgi:hypothetical protein